jgi:quercetin dioxygenase-like cupin family protein
MPSTTEPGQGIQDLPPVTSPAGYFSSRGLSPTSWSAAAGAHFAPHTHATAKHLFVTRGTITFNELELEAPAGIRISAGFEHSAEAGPTGVECVEAFET